MASFLRARATSFRRFRRRLISFVRSLAMAVSLRKPGKARNAICEVFRSTGGSLRRGAIGQFRTMVDNSARQNCTISVP